MSSFEDKLKSGHLEKDGKSKRLDIAMVKYFWMANPLSGKRKDSIPKFLRQIEILKNFSDNELRLLSKSMHHRKFAANEVVFKQQEVGVGFYFIYDGEVDFYEEYADGTRQKVSSLEEYDYFGELALLKENNVRNVTAIAKTETELVGIFRPDLELLTSHHPILTSKFVQVLSWALAEKMEILIREHSRLSEKYNNLVKENDT